MLSWAQGDPFPCPWATPVTPRPQASLPGTPAQLVHPQDTFLWPRALFIEKGLISRSSLGSLEGAERPPPFFDLLQCDGGGGEG